MAKDDATILRILYLIFFICAALVFYNFIKLVGDQTGLTSKYTWYEWVQLGGSALMAGLVVLKIRSSAEREEYYMSSISELRKVTWPSSADVKRMTVVVCVVVAFFAVMLSVFDLVWSKALGLVL